MLKLYNSLNRQKENFHPIREGEIKMYVCGMTVYDYCHIGHARVMVVFDTLARHLREDYRLSYVRNITDIDDKIIKRALENNETIDSLTHRFIHAMHEDEQALGCQRPDIEPRATEHIAGMITLIEQLIAKNYAYQANNGDVYYRVREFEGYGKLSNRDLDDLRAGERIAVNEAKSDPLDFVLWKSAKPNEPSWDSPWGKGRPGWHIECSVMSEAELGTHFDIHGGGMDLKFPHHECEIAQSEGAYGHQHVNYWIHNGFVQIDNEKMSKSLGNFFTVRDVLKKYDGEVIRLFMLQTHYRAPLNYSDNGLNEAKKALDRFYTALDGKQTHGKILEQYLAEHKDAMNDDLNTPKALANLFELTRALNKADDDSATDLATTLKALGAKLGLLQQNPSEYLKGNSHNSELTETNIQALLDERNQAKADKNYARADEIRHQLAQAGIVIKDTANGTEWRYS